MKSIKSMTGYGKGEAEKDGRKVTVEIKTVNHRFFDPLIKLPRGYQFLEDIIRKKLTESIVRGHVDVYFNVEDIRTERSDIVLNEALAKRYAELTKQLMKLGYAGEIQISDALRVPDMITASGEEKDEALLIELTAEATSNAATSLIKMREAEGARLVSDLKEKVADISETVDKVALRAPIVAEDYKEKLTARVKEALEGVQIDESKLANEVTFFIDKSNIDEEVTRLRGHIAAYGDIFKAGGEVGKKLDYLTQETNREVNTIASKSNDMPTTQYALYLKNQVEKIREQVQNLE